MHTKSALLFTLLTSLIFTTGVAEDHTFVSTTGELSIALKKNKTGELNAPLKSIDGRLRQDLDSWFSMFPNVGYTNDWRLENFHNYYEIDYEITVENLREQPLNNIRIEYCIYHEATINERISKGVVATGTSGWRTTEGSTSLPTRQAFDTITGEILIKGLTDHEKITKQTDCLKLTERKESYEIRITKYTAGHSPEFGERHERTIDGKLLGIRCRAYMSTPSGISEMFEFADPECLLTESLWVTPKQGKKNKEEALSRFEKNIGRLPPLTTPR